jgi:hypothetical protein
MTIFLKINNEVFMNRKDRQKNPRSVFGIYRDKSEVRSALHCLKKLGFKNDKISVLYPEHEGARDFPQVQQNQISTGAAIGGAVGLAVVGAIDLLFYAGIIHSTSMNALPSLNPTLAITMTLFLGAVIGAIVGTLVGIGTPESPEKRYGQYLSAGGTLMAVECSSQAEFDHATTILEKTGAQDISEIERETGFRKAAAEMHKLDEIMH